MGSQDDQAPIHFSVNKIAIIGAGPCGLAAARYLKEQNAFETIDVFEQQAEVGGVWNYSPRAPPEVPVPQVTPPDGPPEPPLPPEEGDESGDKAPVFPSPMYDLLHANIPRPLMRYSDLPISQGELIFPSRQEIQEYLVEYARPVRHLIRFSTRVRDVRLVSASDDPKDQWTVDIECLRTGELTRAGPYDAVVVASGHYATVYVPDVPGLREFHAAHPGIVTHAKQYRTATPFQGEKVIVVGNAASGIDIAAQISPVCRKPLLLSVQSPTPPHNLAHTGAEEVPAIAEFLPGPERAVRFTDGRVEHNIDSVIFATGYLYDLPFLRSLSPPLVTNSGRRVQGLYDHLFHIDHPTLAFIGLPIKVVPFPVAESQAALVARTWMNQLSLPTRAEMRRWEAEEEEAVRRGRSPKNFHVWPEGGDVSQSHANHDKSSPRDLSHHYSAVTKRRLPSKIKGAYKFFQIPGIHNLAGLPNVAFFPFDTLEAQAAKPERWTPSPNHPGSSSTTTITTTPSPSGWPSRWPSSSNPAAATHIAVPKSVDESDPRRRIDLATALQYGLAQGYPPLLSWVRQFVRECLVPDPPPYVPGPEVILTCGATDGFAKTLNLFVDQWDEGVDDPRERPGLLCEEVVYTNVLNQARPYGVQVVTVKADEMGMVVRGEGGLEDVLGNWDAGRGKRPHLMYTVTLGHNPTGVVVPIERKREIYAVCSRYDVIIVEDEPYWYLQFPSASVEEAKSRGQSPPPPPSTTTTTTTSSSSSTSGYPFLDSLTPSFLSLDVDGRVVRLDTFSKTVAPGCRLGWLTAQPALIERVERITEATTQQPSGFVQSLISELVLGSSPRNAAARSAFERLSLSSSLTSSSFSGWDTSGWVRWLEGLRGAYERRMVRMCKILDQGSALVTTSAVRETSRNPRSSSSRRPSASEFESDSDSDYVTDPSSEWTPLAVHTTPLLTFRWPKGGMFVWIRVAYETHPLWHAPRATPPPPPPPARTKPEQPPNNDNKQKNILDGPTLSIALMIFLTTAPYRVIIATGSMFDAVDDDSASGWAYHRLCFAAESEERVDAAAERYVRGVHAFWGIRDVERIEDLLGEWEAQRVNREGEEDIVRLDWFGGC
ncbi:hypothetical protein VTJ49DRAFT_4816 [Mycothermus thermophilus]|uniref:Aminotransferase class I/classII large domain-containing protein n=1 Tax=Humicola insolens TaxID=85995 RepID=A0ABR3V5G0_HUMIN